ncbi:DUF6158 family protein [Cryptosporangium sp. NPDC051539]|uniref:DUF6158 family protein n=1 Tax=Cryptosporangium sp. NPDC051539 TaxID=3363962 RepID=UPI0037BDFE32
MTVDGGAGARSGALGSGGGLGVAPERLTDEDLLRELRRLHDTRHETLRHGSDDALDAHTVRLADLESEYLRRRPQREIDPGRLREGARDRE